MARICIECKKEVTDDQECYLIKDDLFIKAVRFIRSKLKMAKNNVLCVHKECAEKTYFSKVKKFKRRLFVAFLVSVGVVVLVSLLQLWAAAFSIQSFVFLVILAIFVFLLFVLGSDTYAPAFYPHLFKGKELPETYDKLQPVINRLELEEMDKGSSSSSNVLKGVGAGMLSGKATKQVTRSKEEHVKKTVHKRSTTKRTKKQKEESTKKATSATHSKKRHSRKTKKSKSKKKKKSQ